ncbi:histone-lysine N-methyltransferase SETMAR-like [Octopus bimaculoides]|uniref:histone-lysine N-methyltransferase SETMAR-like n=1 Tax=Octopus bimaculoides TaxID=37653 RepID=UPI00071C50B7|nr:histone-lysine N-methyltransferase SETMAR-like [Octopus bimaculoides]|eukprot:XP_014790435.1 PREDICTED: histone-lysine N-methyltransferase SETMAR-like [Octopus bimaculoides]
MKLGHNASRTAANINRAWGEESTSDRTVRRWFQKFRTGDENFEDEEGRGWSCSLDNEQSKAIVEQNPRQSVREMSQTLGVRIATVSRTLHEISKVKNSVNVYCVSPLQIKKFGDFKCAECSFCETPMILFSTE